MTHPVEAARRSTLAFGPEPDGRKDGMAMSIMAAVARAAGEPPTGYPRCASPVLTNWFLAWERCLSDAARVGLARYVEPLAHSRGTTDQEVARQWMVIDWVVGVAAPLWLRAAGLGEPAAPLAQVPEVASSVGLTAALGSASYAARAAEAAFDAGWRAVADLAQPTSTGANRPPWRAVDNADADRGLTWSALAEGVRTTIDVSRRIVAPAVAALGFDVEPARAPDVWVALMRAIESAVGAVAWAGAHRLAERDQWSWWTPSSEAWRAGWDASRAALRPAEAAFDRSAHVLVGRLLQVTQPNARSGAGHDR